MFTVVDRETPSVRGFATFNEACHYAAGGGYRRVLRRGVPMLLPLWVLHDQACRRAGEVPKRKGAWGRRGGALAMLSECEP